MRKALRSSLEGYRKLWVSERNLLGLRGNKFGIVAETYFEQFLCEGFDDLEVKQAMNNFLTDSWWSNDGLAYQDLAHFIKNYPTFMPDTYKPRGSKKWTELNLD